MKTLELTAEQMDENCPFCDAERDGKYVDVEINCLGVHGTARVPKGGNILLGVAQDCTMLKWQCGTEARTDNQIARQSLECRINEVGEWVGRLADEITELRLR